MEVCRDSPSHQVGCTFLAVQQQRIDSLSFWVIDVATLMCGCPDSLAAVLELLRSWTSQSPQLLRVAHDLGNFCIEIAKEHKNATP